MVFSIPLPWDQATKKAAGMLMNAKQMLTTVSQDPRFATMFMQMKENISVLISLEPSRFPASLLMLAQLVTAVL